MYPLIERDLSWLQFNKRILTEAADPQVPLLERLRFLGIFSSNLDEFSRVRLPLIQSISQLKNKTKKKYNLEEHKKLAKSIQEEIKKHLEHFGYLLNKEILPQLDEKGIHIYYNETFRKEHEIEVADIFWSKILSFIQPIYLRVEQPFQPENGQPYLLIALRQVDNMLKYAFINIPSDKLPRFFELSTIENKKYLCFIDDIIRAHISSIFPQMRVEGVYSIKLNRNAELFLEEEFSGDVLAKVEKSLEKRHVGKASRLLYEMSMPRKLQWFLAGVLDLSEDELYEGGRYHNLKDLLKLPLNYPELEFDQYKPAQHPRLFKEDLFLEISKKDILLHFPYQSYNPILRFFNQAAIDPDVEAIYISLYRVAEQSHIVNALISAAVNGKKVRVFVELKARFDEENNIRWSRKMEEAGIEIIYSIPNIKVHSKIALISRKEHGQQHHYSLISTGNFNEQTARLYTDHTLFTAHSGIAADLLKLFSLLGKRKPPSESKNWNPKFLLIAGLNMVSSFEQLIEEEIEKAKHGKPALIRIKVNNLEEPGMIYKLYEAAEAGVEVQLLVRTICCIVPQQKNIKERLHVRRIVGRFLEHSRLFFFGHEGNEKVYMGSSDWMTRNLYHRIEVVAPVLDEDVKRELLDCFNLQWSDNIKADELQPDGSYAKIEYREPAVNAQFELMKQETSAL